jgi:branched-chain amino acid transport system ATP-binding protein
VTIGVPQNNLMAAAGTTSVTTPDGDRVLALQDVEVVYDRVIQVLHGVSLVAKPGAITALLGANGAGKTTTLKAISGLLESERGEKIRGTITLGGVEISHTAPHALVKQGVVQVFEGRRVFASLSVEENLIVGGHTVKSRVALRQRMEEIFEFFPRLKERRSQMSGYLSGGEQQMLAIGRALMSDPRVVLLDEPSLGLAPMVVEDIFDKVKQLTQERGLTVLLVEQNAELALEFASYGYCLENGRVVLEGEASELLNDGAINESYLGIGGGASREAAGNIPTSNDSIYER